VKTLARRTLRMDRVTIRSWLDRMDKNVRPPTALSLRRSERFEYRPEELIVELAQPGEAAISYAVAARNVSREGLGFLIGKLVYPGTRCRVTLPSPYGDETQVTGRVARCRYLVGSGSLYEVGMMFDRPIDVTMFAPHARQLHVLLVDAEAASHELFTGFLQAMHVDLACVALAEQALTTIVAGGVDLALIDLESVDFDGFDLTRHIRRAGYVGPVVGMAVPSGEELR
jgi:CheY-like chemotaxis protein